MSMHERKLHKIIAVVETLMAKRRYHTMEQSTALIFPITDECGRPHELYIEFTIEFIQLDKDVDHVESGVFYHYYIYVSNGNYYTDRVFKSWYNHPDHNPSIVADTKLMTQFIRNNAFAKEFSPENDLMTDMEVIDLFKDKLEVKLF